MAAKSGDVVEIVDGVKKPLHAPLTTLNLEGGNSQNGSYGTFKRQGLQWLGSLAKRLRSRALSVEARESTFPLFFLLQYHRLCTAAAARQLHRSSPNPLAVVYVSSLATINSIKLMRSPPPPAYSGSVLRFMSSDAKSDATRSDQIFNK
jgi:hypothetical protein